MTTAFGCGCEMDEFERAIPPADRDTVAKHIAAIRQQLRPTPARTRDADETKEPDRA